MKAFVRIPWPLAIFAFALYGYLLLLALVVAVIGIAVWLLALGVRAGYRRWRGPRPDEAPTAVIV